MRKSFREKGGAGRKQVWKLPRRLRAKVEQMLLDGATLEETVTAIRKLGGHLSLSALARFVRANRLLLQHMLRRRVERAGELKRSLAHPDSPQARLAEVTLFAGVSRLSQGPWKPDASTALALAANLGRLLRQENAELKQRMFGLLERKASVEERIARAKLKLELARWELAKRKLLELKPALDSEGRGGPRSPKMIETLKGIYGLIAEHRSQERGVSK